MQHSLHNPDTRALPEGWADHFDSQRQIWYYVDLHAGKPRISFAHPCDLDRQHPSSAPARVKEHLNSTRCLQRPAGPRKNSSASVNSIIRETQRTRRATVAQQLYASGLNLAAGASGSSGLRPSSATLRGPSVSNSSASEEVASLSARSSTVSTTSSSPLPVSPHLDTHHPRNFFDCTRLAPGTRRMTVNGARPSLTPTPIPWASDADAQSYGSARSFYHPSVSISVNNSPSPIPISAQEPPDTQTSQLKSSQRPLATILSNNAHSSSSTSSRSYARSSPDTKSYKGTTEDNLVILNQVASQTSFSTQLNVSALQGALPGDSGASKKPRSLPPINTTTPILQPKPIRPMHGISLNLQVQVAGIAEAPTQSEPSKSKRKTQLLNFALGGNSKGVWKGKQKQVDSPEDDSGAPSVVGRISSNMDDSFVLVDTLDQN